MRNSPDNQGMALEANLSQKPQEPSETTEKVHITKTDGIIEALKHSKRGLKYAPRKRKAAIVIQHAL